MIIFIFIIVVILFLLYLYNLKDTPNKISQPIINNIEVKKYQQDTDFVMEYSTSPVFRGLSKSSIIQVKDEIGGSKIFNNIKLDDSNLINNVVNYKNYSSYRIKPSTRHFK
jgi:hypothetical protein